MLDYGGVKQRVAAFDEAHSKLGEPVAYNEWLIFPDGARREVNPLGALVDPPETPFERWRRIAYYHQLKLKKATDAFEERRRHLLAAAQAAQGQRSCPPPDVAAEQAQAELEYLREKVVEAQRDFEAAKAKLEQHTPPGIAARREADEENRKAQEAVVAACRKVEV